MDKTHVYIIDRGKEMGSLWMRSIPRQGERVHFWAQDGTRYVGDVSSVFWRLRDEGHVISESVDLNCILEKVVDKSE